jgi:hypothetical protein
MNFMKQFIVIATLVFLSCFSVLAQVNPKPAKTYLVWVKLENNKSIFKGIFHEITDSSILVSSPRPVPINSDQKLSLTEFNFKKIDILQTRKTNSRRNGALIGGGLGFLSGAIPMIVFLAEELGAYTAFPALNSGIIVGVFGLVTGGVAGSVKDRIPIKGSYENFNLYRNALQKYSFVEEYPASINVFEHKWFAGMAYGPAFPLGDLGDKSVLNPLSKFAYTGGGGSVFIGYRFNKYLGFTFYEATNSNPLKSTGIESKYWMMGKIMAGPIISYPVAHNVYLDLKPAIGYADVYFVENDEIIKDGDGPGLNPKLSLTYYYSKRWGIIGEASYFYTKQVFPDKSKEVFQALDLNLGMVYRFGKGSL